MARNAGNDSDHEAEQNNEEMRIIRPQGLNPRSDTAWSDEGLR